MHLSAVAVLPLLLVALNRCPAAPAMHPLGVVPAKALFGPVLGRDVITGRQDAGEVVLLMTDGPAIVRIDLRARRAERVTIAVGPGETCWGLGRLTDGSVWSLKGRNDIIRIEPDGRVSRTVRLGHAHIGLMAAADRLIYQRAITTTPEPALRAGRPGEADEPWSSLMTRSFPGLGRVQAAALSMVTCGGTATADRPCWFPDEAALALIDTRGRTRRLSLAGLAVVSPEVLLTAENPRRPIRDAYADPDGRIWVLSTGDAPAGGSELPGGWLLARYAADGAPEGQVRLAEPARLILRVDGRRATVLAGSGHVSEITPW